MKHFSKYLESTVHEEIIMRHRKQNIENKHKSTLRKAKPRELQYKIFIPHHHLHELGVARPVAAS